MDDRQAISARFAELLKDYSQSEIARRTGHSLSNVNRYASGTRVPADFCAALTKHLGVNPSWLLAGEGTSRLADISAANASMAGDLLELVEAMNAVTHMRLGALSGKHHLRVLRELSDAMGRMAKLRKRIENQARPVFEQLLNDLEKALAKFNIERADELRRASRQVSELCSDEDLMFRLLGYEARLEYQHHDVHASLKLQRRLLNLRLTGLAPAGDELIEETVRFCNTIGGMSRTGEALRICEATLALTDEIETASARYPALGFIRGNLLTDYGKLHQGLALMQLTYPKFTGTRRLAAASQLTRAQLMAGAVGFTEALGVESLPALKAELLFSFAIMTENAEYLTAALEYARHPEAGRLGKIEINQAHPKAVLDAIEGRSGDFESAVQKIRSWEQPVMRTQWLRLCGSRRKAVTSHRKAEVVLGELQPEITPSARILAIHHRNATLLQPKSESAENAKRWFQQRIAEGFNALLPIAPEL